MLDGYFQPTEFRLASRKRGVRDRCNWQVTIPGYPSYHLVPVQTGKFLVNHKEAGFDPEKDEGSLHYDLGIAEKGPGFRKNGY